MRPPPIVLGAIAGLAVAAALTPLAADAMRDLRAARDDRATLAALAAGPIPSRVVVANGYAILAPNAAVAADRLAGRLRAVATANGLQVEDIAAAPSTGLVRVRLRVSGTEDAVIAFADAVERARPTTRFASWSAEAHGGGVTLSGEAVSPWQ